MHEIIDPIKASELRANFITAFVDTSTDYFAELEKVKPTDVIDNYIWHYLYDTLYFENFTIVPFSCAKEFITKKRRVYTMWDICPSIVTYSFDDKVFSPPKPHYLELYESDTVIEWDADELAELLLRELGDYDGTDNVHNTLPEDIYVFDDTLEWCVIFTHSAINGERFCRIGTVQAISPNTDFQ